MATSYLLVNIVAFVPRIYRVKDINDLLRHIQSRHDVEGNSSLHKFNSMEEFQNWKEGEEILSNSFFVTKRAARITNNVKHMY